jgi:hypothetical protein
MIFKQKDKAVVDLVMCGLTSIIQLITVLRFLR